MIKGLSDRLRLPRRGKIRLGEKVETADGKSYPRSLDHFVVPDEVKEVYGKQPRKLEIMLPMEDREVFFPQFYKMYGKSKGLICKGDGEIAMRLDPKTNEMVEIECAGKNCEYFKKGKTISKHFYRCRTIGNLQIVLPRIPGLGIYQIDTSSYNSIINLNSAIEMIREALGRISWVPLVLEVSMQQVNPMIDGERKGLKVPVMTLTCNVTVQELLSRADRKELPGVPKAIELGGGKAEDKPSLLYPSQDEQNLANLRQEINNLFNKLDWEAGRQKALENHYENDWAGLSKLKEDLERKLEGSASEEQLLQIRQLKESLEENYVESLYKDLPPEGADKVIQGLEDKLRRKEGSSIEQQDREW